VRIVSLAPSATEIVFALGLGDELVGRSHLCDYPPEAADIPALTRPARAPRRAAAPRGDALDGAADRGRAATLPAERDQDPAGPGRDAGSTAVPTLGRGARGTALDVGALLAAEPDLVITDDIGDGSPLDRRSVEAALSVAPGADGQPTVVGLAPRSIEGIFNSIATIGAMSSAEDEAVGLLEILRERLGALEEQVQRRREGGVAPRRVVCLEWLDPPYGSGDWIPEQVRRAGGWDLLGREGAPAGRTTWREVSEVDPEHVLLMPCGMTARDTASAWDRLRRPQVLDDLRAVRRGEVIALDSAAYFTRPGPRVIDGIALLAELFDPHGFEGEGPSDGWIPIPPAG